MVGTSRSSGKIQGRIWSNICYEILKDFSMFMTMIKEVEHF